MPKPEKTYDYSDESLAKLNELITDYCKLNGQLEF
jgi:hypothetical protein